MRQSAAARRGRQADQLVEAARRGEPGAFDRLVTRFRPRIYALALHMTGNHSDAEDVTQDAFLKAYRNLPRFEGRSEFFTWLYRIAMNHALDARRKRVRREGLPLDDPRVEPALEADAHGDPARSLELRDTYRRLLLAMDRLSPKLKATVVLTQLQGMSHSEAAVVLGVREGVVAWRLLEARKRLRASMELQQRRPTGRRFAPEVALLRYSLQWPG